eukprot:1195183-Prorocentrum_minimum.AAC.2
MERFHHRSPAHAVRLQIKHRRGLLLQVAGAHGERRRAAAGESEEGGACLPAGKHTSRGHQGEQPAQLDERAGNIPSRTNRMCGRGIFRRHGPIACAEGEAAEENPKQIELVAQLANIQAEATKTGGEAVEERPKQQQQQQQQEKELVAQLANMQAIG